MGEKYSKDKIGLCRDDGCTCFGNINGSQAERIQKEFISIFETEFKLSITSETNQKIVNFSDVTSNLNNGTHEPYNKPNKNPLHIDINSNHIPKIMKNLPENIQKSRTKLSSSTRIFNNSKDLYNNALSASGFQQRIKFEQDSRVMSRIFSVVYLYSPILSLHQFYLNNKFKKHWQYFCLKKTINSIINNIYIMRL